MGLFFICLLAGCDSPPHIDSEDISAILQAGVEAASAKFGPKACFVSRIGRRFPPIPGEAKEESKWETDGKLRYRMLIVRSPAAVPSKLLKGKPVTTERFGCPETIELLQPSIVEIDDQGRREISASLHMNNLCGPICGEEYVMEIAKTADGWSAKPESLRQSGVMF
jgi:hypothetical protein